MELASVGLTDKTWQQLPELSGVCSDWWSASGMRLQVSKGVTARAWNLFFKTRLIKSVPLTCTQRH